MVHIVSKRVADQFPIFLHENYDTTFPQLPFSIGLKSTYPEELFKRIAAAAISYQAGLSSIDYTYKRYIGDKSYTRTEYRTDFDVEKIITESTSWMSSTLRQISEELGKLDGSIIAEWTLLRVPMSIDFLVGCAHRGALFESVLIARAILEQISWAACIDRLHNFEEIHAVSATRSVGHFNKKLPGVGRFYGWMSSHAHWLPERHIQAMTVSQDGTGMVFASSRFKMIAMLLTVAISSVAINAIALMRSDELQRVNSPTGDAKRDIPILCRKLRKAAQMISRVSSKDPDVLELSSWVFQPARVK